MSLRKIFNALTSSKAAVEEKKEEVKKEETQEAVVAPVTVELAQPKLEDEGYVFSNPTDGSTPEETKAEEKTPYEFPQWDELKKNFDALIEGELKDKSKDKPEDKKIVRLGQLESVSPTRFKQIVDAKAALQLIDEMKDEKGVGYPTISNLGAGATLKLEKAAYDTYWLTSPEGSRFHNGSYIVKNARKTVLPGIDEATVKSAREFFKEQMDEKAIAERAIVIVDGLKKAEEELAARVAAEEKRFNETVAKQKDAHLKVIDELKHVSISNLVPSHLFARPKTAPVPAAPEAVKEEEKKNDTIPTLRRSNG